MKKIIAMAITALFFTSGINAQIKRVQDSTFEKNRPVHHKKMVKDNWNKIDLTADQKQKMKENQENLKTQSQAIQNDASLTQDQKKAKIIELQKASREKNSNILTADQKAILKQNQKETGSEKRMKGQRGMKGQKGMKANKDMKGMKANKDMKGLDLSPDQQTKMKDLRSNMQSESMAIKNNSGLSEEQKKQQLQELRKKNMEQMNQLLTPDQKINMKNRQGKMKKQDVK